MKIVLLISLFSLLSSCMQAQNHNVNFGKSEKGESWKIINDGVMGGLSQSEVIFKENSAMLRGKLSLANNGGFASYRSPFAKYDLSSFEKVSIKCKGKGGVFVLMFETSPRFFDPYFKYEFRPESEWQTFECRLEELQERRLLEDTGKLIDTKSLENIIRFGIIKSDKKEGEFELEIDYIRFE